MTLWRNRSCDNCAHMFRGDKLLNVGLCPKLGVWSKNGEHVLDSVDMFKKLGTSTLEYRHPMVRKTFGCCHWTERKEK